MNNFKQKYGPWAIVTGASSGIGKELALQLAQKGLNLVLISRTITNLEGLVTELSIYNTDTKTIALDLKEPNFLSELVQRTKGLDIGLLANVAGEMYLGEYLDAPLQQELDMIRLNITAPAILTHHYSELFRTKRRGGLMITGSMMGYTGTPLAASYAATKAYENAMAEALYYELKNYGVDVIGVVPGLTKTPMTARYDFSLLPMKMGLPEKVASDAIKHIGRKPITTYGISNQMMNWFSKHMIPRKLNTQLFGYFLKSVNMIK